MAPASSAIAVLAKSSSGPHSSSREGHAIQQRSCGSQAAGMRYPSSRGVLTRFPSRSRPTPQGASRPGGIAGARLALAATRPYLAMTAARMEYRMTSAVEQRLADLGLAIPAAAAPAANY